MVRNKLVETVIIPNLCQECHKQHNSTLVKECRFCSDLQFPEQTLCNLVRDEMRDEDEFACHAFRPKLSVVNHDNPEQSKTGDSREDIGSTSQKEQWFKAYAVQQLRIDPDQIYFHIRYHVVFSTAQRAKLLSNQDFDRIDKMCQQVASSFVDTKVYLLCLAPDHMHLYIDSSPDYALDEIMHAVMDYSGREMAMQFPERQKSSNSLWERAYFLEGIG